MDIFPSRSAYYALGAIAAIEIVWMLWAGHSVDMTTAVPVAKTSVVLLAAVPIVQLIARRMAADPERFSAYLSPRWIECCRVFIQGMAFITLGWTLLRLLNHLTMTIPVPYVDGFLTAADRLIPIDWNAYFQAIAGNPLLIDVYFYAYSGLTPISMAGFLILILVGAFENARYFMLTFAALAIVCTTVGLLFPAQGTVHTMLADKSLLGNFTHTPGVYFVDILKELRSGEPQTFNLMYLPGLTTFPSFHTAAGVVLAMAFRRTRLFWPVAVYCAIMIAATPIYGGHYFIDLVAGTGLALVVGFRMDRLAIFNGLFSGRAPQPAVAERVESGDPVAGMPAPQAARQRADA